MEENLGKIIRLAGVGESTLKSLLEKYLECIETRLKDLNDYPKEPISLNSEVNDYNKHSKLFKEKYGVEFSDLKKKYESMLPEIKKYIEVKD